MIGSLSGGNQLILTTVQTGEEGSIHVVEGTALPVLGLVPSVTGQRLLSNIAPDYQALNTKKLRLDLNGTLVNDASRTWAFTGLSQINQCG